MEHEYAIVLTTTETEQQAREMARSILEEKLAACVQIEAIDSIYQWNGELREEREWRLTIKTTSAKVAPLEQHIKSHHAYEMLEIVKIEIGGGSREYLDWIDESIR